MDSFNRLIDLHMHTSASDGECSPKEVVDIAINRGCVAIAITDHDTVQGLPDAIEAGQGRNVEIISGVELSAKFDPVMHILGLDVDVHNQILNFHLQRINGLRIKLMAKLLKGLKGLGIAVTPQQVIKKYHTLTAINTKKYIIEESGIEWSERLSCLFESVSDDWRNNLPDAKECIEVIHACGGMAFLAHPMLLRLDNIKLKKLLFDLKTDGLDGIELIHPKQSLKDQDTLDKLAQEIKLLRCGGSDFHTKNDLAKATQNLAVPYYYLKKIRLKTR